MFNHSTKLISVKEILEKKYRSNYSATYLLAKELNLRVLPIEKNGKIHFTSPIFAELVDVLTKKFRPKKALDLFSGSGALSKIALLNGVSQIKCVDIFTKATETNLAKFQNKVEIVKGDILEMDFDQFSDVVFLDCPSKLLISVVKEVLPKLKTDLVIMYYGGKGDTVKDKKIETLLKQLFRNTFFVRYYLKHACCSSTDMGKRYLNYLQKNF